MPCCYGTQLINIPSSRPLREPLHLIALRRAHALRRPREAHLVRGRG